MRENPYRGSDPRGEFTYMIGRDSLLERTGVAHLFFPVVGIDGREIRVKLLQKHNQLRQFTI